MAKSLKKIALLFFTVYSFFICFIMNVFGYVLSSDNQIYEWNILNIHEGRKQVFNTALIHLCILFFCVVLHFKGKMNKMPLFKALKTEQSVLEEQQSQVI